MTFLEQTRYWKKRRRRE